MHTHAGDQNCLNASDANANLLSTRDLQHAGIGFKIPGSMEVPATLKITNPAGKKNVFRSLPKRTGSTWCNIMRTP